MVGVLYSESRGSGFRPGSVIVLYSWPKHFTVMVSLAAQELKGVPVNCQGSLMNARGLVFMKGFVKNIFKYRCSLYMDGFFM